MSVRSTSLLRQHNRCAHAQFQLFPFKDRPQIKELSFRDLMNSTVRFMVSAMKHHVSVVIVFLIISLPPIVGSKGDGHADSQGDTKIPPTPNFKVLVNSRSSAILKCLDQNF